MIQWHDRTDVVPVPDSDEVITVRTVGGVSEIDGQRWVEWVEVPVVASAQMVGLARAMISRRLAERAAA